MYDPGIVPQGVVGHADQRADQVIQRGLAPREDVDLAHHARDVPHRGPIIIQDPTGGVYLDREDLFVTAL